MVSLYINAVQGQQQAVKAVQRPKAVKAAAGLVAVTDLCRGGGLDD